MSQSHQPIVRFAKRWWFLLVLATFLAAGFLAWDKLGFVAGYAPRDWIIATGLFCMAFPLDSSTMWKTVRNPKAVLLAVTINLGLIPLLGWGIAQFIPQPDLASGLLVASAIPTTLASAAVLTRRAGGNDAVPLMVTMLTNLSCCVVTPFWLSLTTDEAVRGAAGLEFSKVALELVKLVMVPIFTAQLLRMHKPTASWATRQKIPLGVISQCCILSIILVGSVIAGRNIAESQDKSHRAQDHSPANSTKAESNSLGNDDSLETGPTSREDAKSGDRQSTRPIRLTDAIIALVSVLSIHLGTFWLGFRVAPILGLSRADSIAVAYSGSQKTLMVGLQIALAHFGGLAILPIVMYHVGQLILDTLIAERIKGRGIPPVERPS